MKKKILCAILCVLMVVPCFFAFGANAVSNPFTDVKDGKYYTEAVLWGYENGYFNGTSATTFSPDAAFTRAQLVKVLSQIDGADLTEYESQTNFTDVKAGKWYTGAVNWAFSNGIVKGTGVGTFSPNATITRQEMCVMFDNYLAYLGVNLTQTVATVTFTDEANISSWAKTAVIRAQKTGVVSGSDSGTFDPKGQCQRKMAAVIVMNFVTALADATKANDPLIVAYCNTTTSVSPNEFRYVDLIIVSPVVVKYNCAPFLELSTETLTNVANIARADNPDIKIQLAVQNASIGTFEACLYPYSNIYAFGDEMVDYMVQLGFDGIDIDYEFPSSTKLRANYCMLMEYIRGKLDALSEETGKEYYLTMTVPGGATWAMSLYDMNRLQDSVDWFNMMSYDTKWRSEWRTHSQAPAYNTQLVDPNTGLNVGCSIQSDLEYYIMHGIKADKLVPGCGLFGRVYGDVQSETDGFDAVATAIDNEQPHYSQLYFYYLSDKKIGKTTYVRYWDDLGKMPYLYSARDHKFISYDDAESVAYKAQLMREYNVRGLMIFDYITCDYTGVLEDIYNIVH